MTGPFKSFKKKQKNVGFGNLAVKLIVTKINSFMDRAETERLWWRGEEVPDE